jgi:hypothetical protein
MLVFWIVTSRIVFRWVSVLRRNILPTSLGLMMGGCMFVQNVGTDIQLHHSVTTEITTVATVMKLSRYRHASAKKVYLLLILDLGTRWG